MLKHVVMIKLRENSSSDPCCELLKGLREHVSAVRSASWGSNAVATPGAFDFCFVLEFDDLDGLAAYDTSDYHQKLREEVRSIRTVSHTVDYFEAVER
jgi:hypothetical protein